MHIFGIMLCEATIIVGPSIQTIGRITKIFCTQILDTQTMKPADFGAPLVFPIAPP